MYYIKKRIEISASHKLNLNYESKCTEMHGHNWIVTIHCKKKTLNEYGMVIDFTHLKTVTSRLDHRCINDEIEQPTAENIAKYICDNVPYCFKVEVQESSGNIAVYEKDCECIDD